MAQPRPYVVTTNFNDYSTTNPSDQHPGSRFDTEFTEIKQNTDDLNANLAILQRDDGKLSNQAVHKDAFDQDSLALIGLSGYTVRGAWAASTAYVSGDIVTYNQATYLTATAHDSESAFGTDLDATPPKWTLIANAGIDLEGAQVDVANGIGTTNLQGASWSEDAAVITHSGSPTGTPAIGQHITHDSFPRGTKVASIADSTHLTADTAATAAGSSQTVDLGRGFTLTFTYTSTTDFQVFVSGVLTAPSLYAVSGDTLTFTTAPASATGNVIVWGGSVSVEATKANVLTYRDDTLDHRDTAQDYATRVGATVRHFDGASNNVSDTSPAAQSGVYSAKEHAEGTTVPEGSAKSWASKDTTAVASSLFSAKEYASGSSATGGSAKDWAVLATQVSSTDYSSKQYAVGTPPDGSAKEWATTTGAAVDTTFSAKEYAQGSAASTGGSSKNWASQTGADVTGGSSGDKSAKSWSIEEGGTAPADGSAKEWATDTGGVVADSEFSAKAYASEVGANAPTVGSAKEWATTTGSAIASSEFSAKEYAQGTAATGGTAKEWAQDTSAAVDTTFSAKEYAQGTQASTGGSAKDYATKVDGGVSGATSDHSSKAWAVGGTGVTTTSAKGAAKEWATTTGGAVDTSEYSAKEYAIGTTVAAGSAKDWAILAEDSVVDGGSGYSALHWAAKAAGSASTAAATFDSFDDRYLGIMASNASGGGDGVSGTYDAATGGPTDNNDGDALISGTLYFNTTEGEMRVFDGTNWISASAAQNATVLDYTFTLSGSDSTISGSDDNSASLSFNSQESVDVFLNGVKLIPKIGATANDYHLDTTNTVTLSSTAVSGDVILVRVYKTFEVADAVPASTGGTFTGAVTASGGVVGNLTGNASGTAATVTTAAQPAITSVGTLTAVTVTGAITANGGIETDTNSKVIQKGAFMQSSTHQALTLGY